MRSICCGLGLALSSRVWLKSTGRRVNLVFFCFSISQQSELLLRFDPVTGNQVFAILSAVDVEVLSYSGCGSLHIHRDLLVTSSRKGWLESCPARSCVISWQRGCESVRDSLQKEASDIDLGLLTRGCVFAVEAQCLRKVAEAQDDVTGS